MSKRRLKQEFWRVRSQLCDIQITSEYPLATRQLMEVVDSLLELVGEVIDHLTEE